MTANPAIADGRNGETVDLKNLHQTAEQLIKSRERVKTHGEVFTPRRMVHQMLDLVRSELETGPNFVDKTFLEPAAGDGNFLLAILQRKLDAIKKRYQPEFWPTESLFALASIYGIELLEDNHAAAQEGMLEAFTAFHERNQVACNHRTNLWRSAKYLIGANILQGNTLTGMAADGSEIQLSWWNRVPEVAATVQREPFSLASLRGADTGMFDFTIYESYAPCRIDQVHKEVRVDD